jgi:hypothetical protein
MKRIRIVGLCLVAVFAVSAVAAASASAYPAYPEYKICVKAKKVGKTYTGEYTEKACKTKASPAKTGKYELEEWKEGDHWTFASKSKTSTLNVTSTVDIPENVVCKKDTAKGEVVFGGYYTEETITFEGCKANGSKTQPCENAGKEKITIGPRLGLLGYLPGEARTEERLNFAEEARPFATFTCGTETVEVTGEVVGTVENTSKGTKITFGVVGGEQEQRFTEYEGAKEGPIHLTGYPGEDATLQTTEEAKWTPKGIGAY